MQKKTFNRARPEEANSYLFEDALRIKCYMIAGNGLKRKIAIVIMAAGLLGSSLLYADERHSDAEKMVGVWVVEEPYTKKTPYSATAIYISGKIHHEYEFRSDDTFRYDKWYLNKDGLPDDRANTLNKKVDGEGKYSFEKDKDGNDLFIVSRSITESTAVKNFYKYEFEDNNTLKTSRRYRRGQIQRKWKRKDGLFEWK